MRLRSPRATATCWTSSRSSRRISRRRTRGRPAAPKSSADPCPRRRRPDPLAGAPHPATTGRPDGGAARRGVRPAAPRGARHGVAPDPGSRHAHRGGKAGCTRPERPRAATGEYSGLQIDLARALAQRIFGDATKVRLHAIGAEEPTSLLRSALHFLDPLLRGLSILSTLATGSWWQLGMAGRLPEFLCPAECVGQQDLSAWTTTGASVLCGSTASAA